jgi:hypothetical protein
MDRAWELFHKINTRRDVYTNTVNPDQWMENAEAYHREWDAYKQKIPPIMRAILFMNPFAYYMEYCDRMVTGSTRELRLPLGEGRDAIIYNSKL